MKKILTGKKVVITAGPTREYLDPVRYISNESSGKMGYALAKEALKLGASVTLISGPTTLTPPIEATTIDVVSADEMYKATIKESKSADIIICSAAVADYRPKRSSKSKIKKASEKKLTLDLVENPDILKALGERKNENQFLIGFALETENLEDNARKKLVSKNCNLIVANLSNVIGSEKTSIKIIDKVEMVDIKNASKNEAAKAILLKTNP